MNRTALSFLAAFVLTILLLGYFLAAGWREERQLLVERLNDALNELTTRYMLEQVTLLRGAAVQKGLPADTLLKINLGASKGEAPAFSASGTASIARLEIADFSDSSSVAATAYDSLFDMDQPQYMELAYRSEQMDSIAEIYDVTFNYYPSVEASERADALLIVQRKGFAGLSLSEARKVLSVLDYRDNLLRGIRYEVAFSLLTVLGLLIAFTSAYRSLREQERQVRERDGLIANLSHELKTPIATIGVALEALERFGADDNPHRRLEYLALSRGELERLDRMAEGAVASLRGGGTVSGLNKVAVDLDELTREAWKALVMRYGCPSEALAIRDRSEGVRPLADRYRLSLVAMNLLDNAIKYGGRPLQVEVAIEVGGDVVTYSVCDNGAGVPPELRERVFDRFFRVSDAAAGHAIKGHGLGLGLVRDSVEAHGGRVDLSTGPAGGACFRLEIPLA